MITPYSYLHESTAQLEEYTELYPRRGAGGGAGGGGGGGGSKNRNKTSHPTPSGVYPGQPVTSLIPRTPVPFKLSGKEFDAIPFGDGTKRPRDGCFEKPHPFGSRQCGGGTRESVYGNSIYGSGYPGTSVTERGVEGRNLPFFFYPITFPAGNGPAYLYRESEYGNATDLTRPGGPLFQFRVYPLVTYQSTPPYRFHVVADKATIQFLQSAIAYSCTLYNASPVGINIDQPIPVTYEKTRYSPTPEDVVQFYRASSVALLLEGYNNTDLVFNPSNTMLDLPPLTLAPNISRDFIDCINHTVGMSVPLVGGASMRAAPNGMYNGVYAGLLSVFVIWFSVCSWIW